MKVSRSERQTAVFFLEWGDIERLHTELLACLPNISISASTSDGLKREFLSLDELMSFKNSERCQIEELRFVARDGGYSGRSAISFGQDFRNNVMYSIDADEDMGVRLNSFYLDFFDSIRPWYRRIATMDMQNVFAVMGVVFLAGLVAFVAFRGALGALTVDGFRQSANFSSVAYGFAVMVIAAVINHFRGKFFPTGSFAFGDGAKRCKTAEFYRSAVIIGFLISVVSSIVVGFFS